MDIFSASASKPMLGEPGKAKSLADKFESAFLSEMLKIMQPDKEESSFGGGIGEEQFQSFLTQGYADAIVAQGGLGLSEIFERSFTEKMKKNVQYEK